MANKYVEYFNINEQYFPCIDEEAIRAGAPWANTYPHETFITLLRHVERMLSGDKKACVDSRCIRHGKEPNPRLCLEENS